MGFHAAARLRRALLPCSSLIHTTLRNPNSIPPIHSITSAASTPSSAAASPLAGLQSLRLFRSTPVSLSSRRNRFDNESEITEDTILFEGCDYNHFLITVDFPRDKETPAEEKIATYERIAAQVFGSMEEAKKNIYACSTTVYDGFQVLCSEDTSKKFEEIPGVVFVLPDSYIDPVNKQYGGDKYINGEIIHMPPPINYGKRDSRPRDNRRNFGPPQNQNYGPPRNQNFGPPQNQNFGPPQNQNFGPPQNQNFGPPQNQNFGPPQQHQQNYAHHQQNVPHQQQNVGSPNLPHQQQNQHFGSSQQLPPGQQNFVPPQHPQAHQENFAPPQQRNFGPPQNFTNNQNLGPPQYVQHQQNVGYPQSPPREQHFDAPHSPSYHQNSGPERGAAPQQNYAFPQDAPPQQSYPGNVEEQKFSRTG